MLTFIKGAVQRAQYRAIDIPLINDGQMYGFTLKDGPQIVILDKIGSTFDDLIAKHESRSIMSPCN